MSWKDVDGVHTMHLAKGAVVIQAYLKHEPGIKGLFLSVHWGFLLDESGIEIARTGDEW